MEGEEGDKLVQFLVENKLDDHLPFFVDQEIDFETLLVLTDPDLESLGLPVEPYRKLTAALRRKKTELEVKGKNMEFGSSNKGRPAPKYKKPGNSYVRGRSPHSSKRFASRVGKSPRRSRSPRRRSRSPLRRSRSPLRRSRSPLRRSRSPRRRTRSPLRRSRTPRRFRGEPLRRSPYSALRNRSQGTGKDESRVEAGYYLNSSRRNISQSKIKERALEEVVHNRDPSSRNRSSDVSTDNRMFHNTSRNANGLMNKQPEEVGSYGNFTWRNISQDISGNRPPVNTEHHVDHAWRNTSQNMDVGWQPTVQHSSWNTSWDIANANLGAACKPIHQPEKQVSSSGLFSQNIPSEVNTKKRKKKSGAQARKLKRARVASEIPTAAFSSWSDPSEPHSMAYSQNIQQEKTVTVKSNEKLRYEEPFSKNQCMSDTFLEPPSPPKIGKETKETPSADYGEAGPKHLKVVIIDHGNPYRKISRGSEVIIKQMLMKELNKVVLAPNKNKRIPLAFVSWTYTGNIISIVCENDRTLQWLVETVRNCKPWPNASLSVVRSDRLPGVTKTSFWIPVEHDCEYGSEEMVLRQLGGQNPNVTVVKWIVFHHEVKSNPRGHLFIFGIGDIDMSILKAKGMRLNYLFQSLVLNVISS